MRMLFELDKHDHENYTLEFVDPALAIQIIAEGWFDANSPWSI